MSNSEVKRSGGQVLVDALRVNGVERAFCVPGESYLAVLDALHDVQDDIELIVCRQEGGAAYMAEAYGKLTGKPGICMVTRGPGATNASVGVHTAFQDSTPMILFIGQVARDQIEREAFQEVDYRRMFGQMAKWVVQIDDAARIPELINQAFQRAISGRPGPVVVALPEDMLTDLVQVSDARPAKRVEAAPAPEAMAELQQLLTRAERPLVVAGGGGWTAEAVADLKSFVQTQNLPLAASFRCQDLFDNTDPHYAGDLGLAAGPVLVEAVKQSDLLIVVGARLGEMTTGGYALVDIPTPKQALVHVHPSAEEIGRVYQPTLGINAGPGSFLRQVNRVAPVRPDAFEDWTVRLNRGYLGNFETPRSPGNVQMSEVIAWLNKHLPSDSILTCGAGNYTGWVHRGYQHREFRTLLGPTNGSMGYGVPAAVAAKLTYPQRTVVAFAGDGCFMMNGQELATAAHYGARVITIVVNNGMYGTIRMHQERSYPGRVSGTELHNPDFAALARAYGLHGETVTRTEDFVVAFERCQASGKPALIEIQVDPEALTPRMTLSQIRDKALQAQR
ncbi:MULTISPECIES: thiamine pyrophosphate-binding protein [Pseudomonas]|uniref:thiamine pyrophosphate-binding protein n=1 Tax=Pseudomonas TaxID=286 RepID=UPI001571C30D|nr:MULTISPECIES: thiamine pyrophosphate-binding protein [Pseudomonas]MBG6128170.1 acetolactate synthase-1/2/3 large subunit [Pseudomonas sp. M2]NSX19218.1 thiamine pyrophosphate-binding protein [Pseudomonas putida]HDS1744046.1 thiamine pyrophosphate-binding protein [Pseudomonas putida]